MCLSLLACLALAGCVSEGPPRRSTVDQSRRPDAGDRPVAMLMAASQAQDTNGDGIGDTIPVTVYLFADPARFTAPYWRDGAFDFWLVDDRGGEVKRWRISGPAQREGRMVLSPGPGYAYSLPVIVRELPPVPGGLFSLLGSFETGEGARVGTNGSATVRLVASGR